jgi:hypothetical protein
MDTSDNYNKVGIIESYLREWTEISVNIETQIGNDIVKRDEFYRIATLTFMNRFKYILDLIDDEENNDTIVSVINRASGEIRIPPLHHGSRNRELLSKFIAIRLFTYFKKMFEMDNIAKTKFDPKFLEEIDKKKYNISNDIPLMMDEWLKIMDKLSQFSKEETFAGITIYGCQNYIHKNYDSGDFSIEIFPVLSCIYTMIEDFKKMENRIKNITCKFFKKIGSIELLKKKRLEGENVNNSSDNNATIQSPLSIQAKLVRHCDEATMIQTIKSDESLTKPIRDNKLNDSSPWKVRIIPSDNDGSYNTKRHIQTTNIKSSLSGNRKLLSK